MKNYREIEFGIGNSIKKAVEELKKHKDLVCGSFNGTMLYSDIDDIETAYLKITGITKSEFEEEERIEHEKYEDEKKKHKESIPQLTIEWIEKGKAILDEKYLDLWNKCVPIRLGDLYRGMELGACLDIVKELNSGCELEVAKSIIDKQGHSGMSYGLVKSMIYSFCDRGIEFTNYLNKA